MSWQNVKNTLPKIAASALAQYVVVQGDTTTDEQVYTAGSNNVDLIGVSLASVPTYGYAAAIAVEGVVKILVAASVGANARVTVASSNGAIGPISASGVLPSGVGPSGNEQLPRYSIGVTQSARAAGEYASVFLDPREII